MSYSFENFQPVKPLFLPLGRIRIKDNTYLVISMKTTDGKISIAQQVVVDAGDKPMNIFLKNAIEVSAECLYDIRDLLDDVIREIFERGGEKKEKEG